MDRWQCKNTFNHMRAIWHQQNAARPEHPKPDEAQESDLKNNLMKIIEEGKKDMKNTLKEIGKSLRSGR